MTRPLPGSLPAPRSRSSAAESASVGSSRGLPRRLRARPGRWSLRDDGVSARGAGQVVAERPEQAQLVPRPGFTQLHRARLGPAELRDAHAHHHPIGRARPRCDIIEARRCFVEGAPYAGGGLVRLGRDLPPRPAPADRELEPAGARPRAGVISRQRIPFPGSEKRGRAGAQSRRRCVRPRKGFDDADSLDRAVCRARGFTRRWLRRRGRCPGAPLRGPGGALTRGDDELAGGAALLRSGTGLSLRLQPRRGDPVVPSRRGARPGVRDGLLGDRLRQRPPHQQPGASRRSGPRRRGTPSGKATAAASGASPVEKALVDALAARYADPQPEDRAPLDQAYADTMRAVWIEFPEDADVGALFAESLADLRPWDLWLPDGSPQPGTEELLATLDAVLALDPRHPLANHLLIHVGGGLAASREGGRVPPTRCGTSSPASDTSCTCRRTWTCVAAAGRRRSWRTRRRSRPTAATPRRLRSRGSIACTWPTTTTCSAYAAMMTGQSELALGTIRAMVADIPLEFFRENPFADGFMAMPLEVLMRFGRWDEILAEPAFPDFVPISRALQHYARAVAYAAKDDVPSARSEQAAFLEARGRVPEEAFFGNNSASDVLDVAEHLMEGEILYRAGRDGRGARRAGRGGGGARISCATTSRPTGSSRCATRTARPSCRPAASPRPRPCSARTSRSCPTTAGGCTVSTRALQLQRKTAEAEAAEAEVRRGLEEGRHPDQVALPLPARGVRPEVRKTPAQGRRRLLRRRRGAGFGRARRHERASGVASQVSRIPSR